MASDDRDTSGRPPRQPQLNVRMSATQYDALCRRAYDAGMNLSELVRLELKRADRLARQSRGDPYVINLMRDR